MEKIEELYKDVQVKANKLISTFKELYKMDIRITSAYRSFEEQEKLYSIGRGSPGQIVTMAQPGFSAHNYRLAFDVCFRGTDPWLDKNPKRSELWEALGCLGESFSLEWAGRWVQFKELPHFQSLYNFKINELYELHRIGGIDLITKTLDERITFK